MRSRLALAAFAALLSGCPTRPQVAITAPFEEEAVVSASFAARVRFGPEARPATFRAEWNGVDVTGRFAVSASGAEAVLETDAPPARTGRNRLRATVQAGSRAHRDAAEFSIARGNAVAARVTAGSTDLLIEGPNSRGRVGDWVLYNDLIQVLIDDAGGVDAAGNTIRDPYGAHVFGGNILDADLRRAPGDPERDNFESWTPWVNIENTFNWRSMEIVNGGSDGAPAVLRAEGVDDILDNQNYSSSVGLFGGGAFQIPARYDENDLPIEAATVYTLAPGDNFVTVETTVKNLSEEEIRTPLGDIVVGGGQLEIFGPGMGYGGTGSHGLNVLRFDVPYLAYVPLGAEARGVSYGYVPEAGRNEGISRGFNFVLNGEGFFDILLGGEPRRVLPPGGTATYTRRFVVGGGGVSEIASARDRALGIVHGRVEGTALSGGNPVAGARVSALALAGALFQDAYVAGGFETDADGRFTGSLAPGVYNLHVNASGYATAPMKTIAVAAGETAYADFSLAPSGFLDVTIVDESGAPSPGRVSVVGVDPTPSRRNILDILGFVTAVGGVFRNDSDLLPRGVSYVEFVGPEGRLEAMPIEPGEYELVVSRGPEYDVHRERFAVAANATTALSATVLRVLDTSGFVSGDFHQHQTASMDSGISDRERVVTNLAEGMDFFTPTDHDFLADLRPAVAALGAEALVATATGVEVTPVDYGHLLPWPVTPNPASRNKGALDWSRPAPPGKDFPRYGNYRMSPGEMFAALRALDPDPGPEVVTIAHINFPSLGQFISVGVDTARVPPRSTEPPEKFRLDPALPNIFSPDFDAMEIWIGSDLEQLNTVLNESWGDWFNLLNQGLVRPVLCDSDTHTRRLVQVGHPRTFLASPADAPGEIDADDVARAALSGGMSCTNGPFVAATLDAPSTGEAAGLGWDEPRTVRTTDGAAVLRATVQAAPWVDFDEIDVFVNAAVYGVDHDGDPETPPHYRANPTLALRAGEDFALEEVPASGSYRKEARIEVPLASLGTRDAWVVVAARGTVGRSRTLFPVVPNDIDEKQTLEGFFTNDPAEPGVRSLAFTNALFIDADGDGAFDPRR